MVTRLLIQAALLIVANFAAPAVGLVAAAAALAHAPYLFRSIVNS